ncbi:MAG: V-type ATPase subunit [Candidatus Thorarchaeota archaeon]|nr:V-type ATPase subunit [Candidatus Thorarchaeota archaeon]
MSFRAANEYAFVNARVRGLKFRFLGIGDYERLVQSASYDEFVRTLLQTYYGPAITREFPYGEPSPEDLALILGREFAGVIHRLSRSLTGRVREFASSYMNMFLAESLKSLIRGLHVGLDKSEILRFSVPTSPSQAEVFSHLVEAGSVIRMVEELPYPDVKLALLTRLSFYEELESTAPLEVALEEWYLRSVLKSMDEFPDMDRHRIVSLLEPRVVLRNMIAILRAAVLQFNPRALDLSLVRFTARSNALTAMLRSRPSWREVFSALENTRYAPLAGRLARIYEQDQNLAEIELAVEDHLAQRMKVQLAAFPFHPGTVFGFCSLKYIEIKNLRSIAVGIERGESAEVIRRMITIW